MKFTTPIRKPNSHNMCRCCQFALPDQKQQLQQHDDQVYMHHYNNYNHHQAAAPPQVIQVIQ